jgi:hypothetical protein
MNTIDDYYRTRALEALSTYGQPHAEPTLPSRTYWVYEAWRYGERGIAQLAEMAGVSRQTIYSDLARYEVEVPEDLERRLTRWIEDTALAGPVSSLNSDYMGIAGNAYRRVWTAPAEGGGRIDITLTMWITGGTTEGSWTRATYDSSGEYVDHVMVPITPLTSPRTNANWAAITKARGQAFGISMEQAINAAVQQQINKATLADLHASYRTSWI